MDSGILSVRYAKALLLFATDNNEEDLVYAETATLADTFLKVPALQQTLLNPVMSDEQKSHLLLKAACGDAEPTRSLTQFVKLLLKKGRVDNMMFVAHSYGTLYRKEKKVVKGRLVVPTSISPQIVDRFQRLVEARTSSKVDFEVIEDASLGGGFVLEYDTYCLDASVKSQLAKLQRQLAR